MDGLPLTISGRGLAGMRLIWLGHSILLYQMNKRKKKELGDVLFFKLYIECGDFGQTHWILGHLDSGFSEYWL